MRIPGVNTLSRIPVPPIVQAALAPVVRQSTMYAVSLAGALDHLATVARWSSAQIGRAHV